MLAVGERIAEHGLEESDIPDRVPTAHPRACRMASAYRMQAGIEAGSEPPSLPFMFPGAERTAVHFGKGYSPYESGSATEHSALAIGVGCLQQSENLEQASVL